MQQDLTCSTSARKQGQGTEQQQPQLGHFPAGTGHRLLLDALCLHVNE